MRVKLDDDNYAVYGVTSEGYGFSMTLTYAPGAPDGANPIQVTGCYMARDGFDHFDVEKYVDVPAVITEGEWW